VNSKSSILIFLPFVLIGVVILVSVFTSNKAYADLFSFPRGIAVDPSSNVFVAQSGKILKFTNTGGFIREWRSSGNDIAVDKSGNVFVTHDTRVLKFTNTGKFIRQWDFGGFSDGDFPAGIAVDKSGNVFVTDSDNDKSIQKFSNTGTIFYHFI
jgi:DNA-binding beta-propeller fold protein YncE